MGGEGRYIGGQSYHAGGMPMDRNLRSDYGNGGERNLTGGGGRGLDDSLGQNSGDGFPGTSGEENGRDRPGFQHGESVFPSPDLMLNIQPQTEGEGGVDEEKQAGEGGITVKQEQASDDNSPAS